MSSGGPKPGLPFTASYQCDAPDPVRRFAAPGAQLSIAGSHGMLERFAQSFQYGCRVAQDIGAVDHGRRMAEPVRLPLEIVDLLLDPEMFGPDARPLGRVARHTRAGSRIRKAW